MSPQPQSGQWILIRGGHSVATVSKNMDATFISAKRFEADAVQERLSVVKLEGEVFTAKTY